MVTGFGFAKTEASFYTGILISAFSLAESITSIWWGVLSDRIGRKPVLLIGCFGTMLSLLIVGFSKSFTVALFGRVLGGLLNGNIGMERRNEERANANIRCRCDTNDGWGAHHES